MMDDVQFYDLLEPGEHFWLCRARRDHAKGALPADVWKTYVEFVSRLKAYLLSRDFRDAVEFVKFKNSYRGYVEVVFEGREGVAFFKTWMREPLLSLGVRLCLVNLFDRLRNPGNWEAVPDDFSRLEKKTDGWSDGDIVDYLIHGKIMVHAICLMAEKIEQRTPALVSARIDDYVNGLEHDEPVDLMGEDVLKV